MDHSYILLFIFMDNMKTLMLQAVYVFHSENMDDPIHARYV